MRKTKQIAIATTILTLLSTSAVFAATTTSNTSVQAPKFSQTQSGRADGGFKSHLDSLLSAGTITQAQEDAIQTALTATKDDSQKGPNDGFKTALDTLVTAGTITQAQEDAIQTALTATKDDSQKGPTDGLKTALDTLVTAGTITQAQEDAIQGS
ncbi:MAG: hypothetical protein P4L49_15735 [Desulfosporosinus sp.]|nr:hypothetical protein [Desulfosporosinus sp.]